MKAANKIAIARALHHLVRSFRDFAGRPDTGVFRRRGVVYELDLSQSLEFAIYLGGMFERSAVNDPDEPLLAESRRIVRRGDKRAA